MMKPCLKNVTMVFIIATTIMTDQHQTKKFATKEARIEFAKKNFLYGLRSENNGVVESTLMLVAKLSMSEPTVDIAELRLCIDSLASSSPSGPLHYKAYVVSNMCIDPVWFSSENSYSMKEPDHFYIVAARRLQSKMLGMNSL